MAVDRSFEWCDGTSSRRFVLTVGQGVAMRRPIARRNTP